MAKYSKEKIIEILKNLSKQLGRPNLSLTDIAKVIPTSAVYHYFGKVSIALKEAGLEATDSHKKGRREPKYTDEDLFQALYKVEREIGHEPKVNENNAHGDLSTTTYRVRFGKWRDVLAHYKKWKSENAENLQGFSIQDEIGQSAHTIKGDDSLMTENQAPLIPADPKKHKPPEQFYGEPIDFRGLRHAPINEQGVVFVFAMVSRELGFNIESIQQGFPDCEGKYLYDKKKKHYAKARIEFEYRASSFQEHGHDLNQCDFIVCWENDWPECPVNIIELKTEIMKLPSR